MLDHTVVSRDLDDVVLVDAVGTPIGRHNRFAVHTDHTPLHLAFSTYLFDGQGRVLLTRRALSKATWPGVWTNSCCGHPRPGEDPRAAIVRRVREELGLEATGLRCLLPDFAYRAQDSSGIVENELCPVWIGHVDPDHLSPDPDEVMEYAWVPWDNLRRAVESAERVFSPWSALQVPLLDPVLRNGHLNDPQSRGADATRADVDALLQDQGRALGRLWHRFAPGDPGGILPDDLPRWLHRLATAGGKRFRVDLCHWGFAACGGDWRSDGYTHLVQAAVALEMLHFFALVHDDVMDRSDVRRGLPAAHVQAASWHREFGGHGDADIFGQNLAILLGDLAHAQADRLVTLLPARLRDFWYELNIELIAGQRADLTGAAEGRRDLAHAERVADLKSGAYSVQRPLLLGALAAGASKGQQDALASFGRHIGRAFALRDDLLGIWGDPALTGKPAGNDLSQGKATVILALAQDLLEGAAAAALARIGTPDATDADVALLQEALVASGVRTRVEAMVAEEVRLANAALRDAPLSVAGAAGLRAMADQIAWRRS